MRCLPLAFALLLAGCPGELENREDFPDAPLPNCQLDIDIPGLFQNKCGSSTCHEGDGPAAELDLVDPGVYDRLVNVPATQCEGRVRVDPNEPGDSFLMEKLRGVQPPGCGDRMPFVSFLTGAEIACVQRWLIEQELGIDGGMPPERDAGMDGDDLGASGDEDMSVPDEDMGAMSDDMGPEPVDCSALMGRADTEFCEATADTCSAEAQNMTTCDDLCAAAGLVCIEAADDLADGCGADTTAPATCDDATKMAYHCLCGRE